MTSDTVMTRPPMTTREEKTMTLHIQMLYEVAKNAKGMADAAQGMADAMQAIVDDCAEQLAVRKAAGETDEAMLNEVFGGKANAGERLNAAGVTNAAGGPSQQTPAGMTPYDGPTPFDEKAEGASAETPPTPTALSAPGKPSAPENKLTIVELRAYVAERSTPENRPKIKAILSKFGVKKLTELSEDKYEAVKSEVAAL